MIRVLRPVPVDSVKLLVFDLDGTLIDSAQDLCNSVNATLEHFGRPHLSDEIIASYIGNGALTLVRRANSFLRMRTSSSSITIANTSSITRTPTKVFLKRSMRCTRFTISPTRPRAPWPS